MVNWWCSTVGKYTDGIVVKYNFYMFHHSLITSSLKIFISVSTRRAHYVTLCCCFCRYSVCILQWSCFVDQSSVMLVNNCSWLVQPLSFTPSHFVTASLSCLHVVVVWILPMFQNHKILWLHKYEFCCPILHRVHVVLFLLFKTDKLNMLMTCLLSCTDILCLYTWLILCSAPLFNVHYVLYTCLRLWVMVLMTWHDDSEQKCHLFWREVVS